MGGVSLSRTELFDAPRPVTERPRWRFKVSHSRLFGHKDRFASFGRGCGAHVMKTT